MFYQRTFAMIDGDGVVQNRAVVDDYETANQIARAVFGDNAIAAECSQYKIGDGYIWKNNTFYEPDGETEVERIPDVEDSVETLQNSAETAISDNVELDYRLCMLELGL